MTQPHPFLALVEKIYTAANAPTFAQSYRVAVQLAEQDGIEILSYSRARHALSDAVDRRRMEARKAMRPFFSPEQAEALGAERRHRNLERQEASAEESHGDTWAYPIFVQDDPFGPLRRAFLVNGKLHWVPPQLDKEAVAFFRAIRDECVRANREVPAAISAGLLQAELQSSAEGPLTPDQVGFFNAKAARTSFIKRCIEGAKKVSIGASDHGLTAVSGRLKLPDQDPSHKLPIPIVDEHHHG